MMQTFRRLSIVRVGATAALIALGSAIAAAQDRSPDTVVATVDGQPLTERDLSIAIADLDEQFARLPEDQRRAAALTALIEIRLFASAAEEKGLADNDDFKRRMELLRQRALHSAFIDQEIDSRVSEEAVRARYDEHVASTPPTNEIHARHIIVRTQEEAAEIIAALDAGGDFEALAREHSFDGAASQGGDLGYFGQGQMVPEFEQAAFALEVGSHSAEPVQTQFGWHVIKVEDKRMQQPPAFDAVQGQLRSMLVRESYLEAATRLRAGAEVEIADPALKSALEPAGEAAPEQPQQQEQE